MIILAIICTLVAGVIGAFLEPVSFSVSLPIAVMGGFILYDVPHFSVEYLPSNRGIAFKLVICHSNINSHTA